MNLDKFYIVEREADEMGFDLSPCYKSRNLEKNKNGSGAIIISHYELSDKNTKEVITDNIRTLKDAETILYCMQYCYNHVK